MELKSRIITFSLLSLLFLVLFTIPCLSKEVTNMDSGVYDIDYRGPETHSYIPPPNGSNRKASSIHQETTMAHRKSKGLRASNGGRGEKIDG